MGEEARAMAADCDDCGAPGKVYFDGVLYCTRCALGRRIREQSTDSLHRWLNMATADDLAKLRGIGPVIAQRIVVHRERNGPFEAVEDVLQVTGVGRVALAALNETVIVKPVESTAERATRYERRSGHLPALGEAARDFTLHARKLRLGTGRRSRWG